MSQAPVLLLAYNRPEKLAGLINSLRLSSPSTVLLAVDGPRNSRVGDAELVAKVQQCANLIDWTSDLHVRFRESNLGLKTAVVDAVSWAISDYGRAIVIEEDCKVGEDFLPFMNHCLSRYEAETKIAHISGYNVVPPSKVSARSIRATRYPESIAWATWSRAWKNYDDQITWGVGASLAELEAVVGSKLGAIKWKMNFSDAVNDRISTWAYRWIASYWSKNQFAISPNANLVTYTGFDVGSHTRTKAPWDELPVAPVDINSLSELNEPLIENQAEKWLQQNVFAENLTGVCKGAAVSVIRSIFSEA